MKMEVRKARMLEIEQLGKTEKVMRLIAEGNGGSTVRIESGLPLRLVSAAFETYNIEHSAFRSKN